MRRLSLLVTIVAPVALAAACGGGGKPLTLDEYFQGLKAVSIELHTQEAPILSTLNDSQNVQELKDALAHYPDVVTAYLKGLEDLKPPEEASQAHRDAVTAGTQFRDALKTAIKDTQNVTTVDDFFGAANAGQIFVASNSIPVACDALQQVADNNQITVDLGCPAEP